MYIHSLLTLSTTPVNHTYGSGNALDWIKTWKKRIKFGQRLFTTHPHVARYILFETRTGDEKDDNNSLRRFGVLHLLQREE